MSGEYKISVRGCARGRLALETLSFFSWSIASKPHLFRILLIFMNFYMIIYLFLNYVTRNEGIVSIGALKDQLLNL